MSLHLVKGSDAVLLSDAARDVIDAAVGEADRSEVLDEFSGDEYELGEAVMAASTVSMFGPRVVVARNCARFSADGLAVLFSYFDNPSPDASLILVWDKPLAAGARANPVPKKLADAVKAAGGDVIDASLPTGNRRSAWLDEQVAASGVSLSPRAVRSVTERLGDDLQRLGAILAVLESTFGTGSGPLEPEDVEPFLGESGSVPPWELTDAIDGGRVAESVDKLQRMLAASGTSGPRHPLQVMVTLTTHVERMMRLDGASVRDEKEAAALLGMKGSSYPAKKALNQSRQLGSAKLARAVSLLAAADVDLRGATEMSGQAVLEVLVARLAALSGRRR